jgi:RNA polymerase sigma factor (sigma-70 family)
MTPEQRRQINEQMVRLARNGHAQSWGELYVLLRPLAVGMAARKVRDPHDVEDVIQTSFLRLHEICHRFRAESNAISFYEHILVNVIRENHARHKRHVAVSPSPGLLGIPEELPSHKESSALTAPEHEAHLAHFWQRFDKAMSSLTPAMQEAVLARLVRGMTSNQAAEESNCSPALVRKRLERALIKLRDGLRRFS